MFGLGGQRMREAGVELEGDISHTAVVGPFEAITYFGALYRVFKKLSNRVEAEAPHAAILIDFPDFNLRLAKRLKHAAVSHLLHQSSGLGVAARTGAPDPKARRQDAGHLSV